MEWFFLLSEFPFKKSKEFSRWKNYTLSTSAHNISRTIFVSFFPTVFFGSPVCPPTSVKAASGVTALLGRRSQTWRWWKWRPRPNWTSWRRRPCLRRPTWPKRVPPAWRCPRSRRAGPCRTPEKIPQKMFKYEGIKFFFLVQNLNHAIWEEKSSLSWAHLLQCAV